MGRHPWRRMTSRLAQSGTDTAFSKFQWFGRVEHCQTLNWAFSVTAGEPCHLSFPGVSPSRISASARTEGGLICRHVVGAALSVRVGARRSTGTGSARWFLIPKHTWEPLLLTRVVKVRAYVGDRTEWALVSGRKSATHTCEPSPPTPNFQNSWRETAKWICGCHYGSDGYSTPWGVVGFVFLLVRFRTRGLRRVMDTSMCAWMLYLRFGVLSQLRRVGGVTCTSWNDDGPRKFW